MAWSQERTFLALRMRSAPSALSPCDELEVCALSSRGELALSLPEWDRLYAACPDATPFQSPAWIVPWLAHFGGGELCSVGIYRGDRLVALAPWQLSDGPVERTISFVGGGISDYGGVLVAPGGAGEGSVDVLLGHLAEQRARYDLCVLDQLPPTDPLYAARLPPDLSDEPSDQETCPELPLPTRVESLARQLPHRLGPRIQRSLRRLTREGQARFERAESRNLEELLDAFFDLHAARWHTRRTPGVLADGTVKRFHRDVAAGMLARQELRLHALRLDGRIEAALYAFVHGRRVFSYLSGFSPRLSALSPGTLMIWRALAVAIEEGHHTFDFLRGGESYKYDWGAQDRWNRLRLVRPAT